MKREDILWTLTALLLFQGYLLNNLISALLGVGLGLYIVQARKGFSVNVKVERIVEDRAEEGKKVRVTLKLKNLGNKVKVRIIEELPKNIKAKLPDTIVLDQNEEKIVEYYLIPEKKGSYELSAKLIITDEKELYYEEIVLGKSKLDVYPSVDSIKEAARQDYNIKLREAYRKDIFFGMESIELHTLREYLPGDDLKKIDWKATARLGELIVREFLREKESDIYIVLDSTAEMRKGVRRAKIDYASTLALHLATLLIKKGYSVGMVVYGDKSAKLIYPSKRRDQLEKFRNAIKFVPKAGLLSTRAKISVRLTSKARKFLRKLFPSKRKSFVEVILNIRTPSYLIFISDVMSHTSELYRLFTMIRKKHRILLLSPNPLLFYDETLDKESLKNIYQRYIEREEIIRKFNALVPAIDLGPSDYLRELSKRIG